MKYFALIVAILTGWVISQYLLADAPGAYVSVLFAYHFFLAFLIACIDWNSGFRFPAMRFVSVHTPVLFALLGFIVARHYIPLFGVVSAILPAFALLEVEWIFGKEKRNFDNAFIPELSSNASQQDYNEFLLYLKQPGRRFGKPGRPVQEEYGVWLAERSKERAANKPRGSAGDTAQGPRA